MKRILPRQKYVSRVLYPPSADTAHLSLRQFDCLLHRLGPMANDMAQHWSGWYLSVGSYDRPNTCAGYIETRIYRNALCSTYVKNEMALVLNRKHYIILTYPYKGLITFYSEVR